MDLFFTRPEFQERINKTREAMKAQHLDAMLIFAQESMYWLTGYDTFGYCFFQCFVLTKDDMVLLTRSADLRQAQQTSIIKDIRIWKDGAEAAPAQDLKQLLNELSLANKRLGIELDTHGLTAANYQQVEKSLTSFAELIDHSYLISELRLIKSPQEIEYVKKAAQLADQALDKGLIAVEEDKSDASVLAAMQGHIFAASGGYPANEMIIGSGPDALLCRYKSTRRQLDANDQITLEWAGVYARYHAAMMRTIIIGRPKPRHLELFKASKAALQAVSTKMTPGHTFGDVFAAHSKTLDEYGLSNHRLNACGYSLGARFTPSWMEHQMFYEDNPQPIQPNMTLFAHMIIMDSNSETAMCLGQTYLTGQNQAENLSGKNLEMIVV